MPASPTPFRILITGVPGTGKTVLARALTKKFHARVLVEKKWATHAGIGKKDPASNEYDVDLKKLQKALKHELHAQTHSLFLEGHLSCEFPLKVDAVIVLSAPRKVLEQRLRARKYSEVKIQENVFCAEEKYVESRVEKNYSGVPMLRVETHRTKKDIERKVGSWVQRIISSIRGKLRETHSFRRGRTASARRHRTRAHTRRKKH